MPRALGLSGVILGLLLGPTAQGYPQAPQIEAGKRIGAIALDMSSEEVVRHLGPPDRIDSYEIADDPSWRPERYVYDARQLDIRFDQPLQDEIPSRVYMIHTTSHSDVGANGVTIGSASAEVAMAYGPDYERVQGEGYWAMFYGTIGIRFECEPGSDRVRRIGVFVPLPPLPAADSDELDEF